MNVYTEVCMFSDIVLTGHCHEIYTSPEFKGKALIAGTGALFERKKYVNCFYAYDIDFTKEGNQKRIQYSWNANHWCNYEESFKLKSTYCRDLKIKTGHEKPVPAAMASQSNLYHIAGQIVKYIPIVGSWKKGEDEYYYGDFKVQTCNEMYQLPKEILDCFHNQSLAQEEIASIKDNLYEEKVRFDEFKVQINGGDRPHIFNLQFSRATYRDFLIVKSVIDQALPSGETVRAKYLSEKNTLISHKLPNVCGVGIFIITSDKKLLISKSSPYVLVNPEQYIYSASGSMNWKGISTNPFHEWMCVTK